MQTAFVLNLDSRPDRWKAVRERFKGSALRLRRISAVKNENGAYGNFMSFLKVFRMAKREGLQSILILEDDVAPARGWESKWRDVKGWLDAHPDEWDIYAGGARGGSLFIQNITERLGLRPTAIDSAGVSTLFKYPLISLGTHWIYVRNQTFDRIIQCMSPLQFLPKLSSKFGIDILQGLFFRVVSSYPFIAYQDSSYSNIIKGTIDTRKLIQRSEKHVKRTLTRRAASRERRDPTE